MDEFAQAPDLDNLRTPQDNSDGGPHDGCCQSSEGSERPPQDSKPEPPIQKPTPEPTPDGEPDFKPEPNPDTLPEPEPRPDPKPQPAPAPSPAPPPKPPAAEKPSSPVAQFAGRWNGPKSCDSSGDAAYRWVVSLTQNDMKVSGTIRFHRCPGGGRALYGVTGTATAESTITLKGNLVTSRGPLAEQVSKQMTFTLSKFAPPAPNLAP